jgi:hydrogenase maturation protease
MKALVVGYGNVLRGDDGVGPWVAATIAAMAPPDMRVRSMHQLTPELAESLAQVEIVIFVDARLAEPGAGVAVSRLQVETSAEALGHVLDPGRLLALTRALYGVVPDAYLVMIPATSFAVGDTLSPLAKGGAEAALSVIRQILTGEPVGVRG